MPFDFQEALNKAGALPDGVGKILLMHTLKVLNEEWPKWKQDKYPSGLEQSIALVEEAQRIANNSMSHDSELIDFRLRFNTHIRNLQKGGYRPRSYWWGYYSD